MKAHIEIKEWLTLDNDARRQLCAKFNIRRSAPTEIIHQNGTTKLISDGVSDRDLDEAFSIEHLIEYLKDELPWYREDLVSVLFKLAQDKFYGRPVKWDERGGSEAGSATTGTNPRGKGRNRKEAVAVPEVTRPVEE